MLAIIVEINAEINVNKTGIRSYNASTNHALKYNKKEVLEHLKKSTPPEIITLFTEAMLGDMIGVRDIVSDTPSEEIKEQTK